MDKLKLYSYWRSSCSFRVRIALHFKGIDFDYIPVNLVKGEQLNPEIVKLNPIGCVPILVDGDAVISDSFAICLYLEEKFPLCPLLPSDIQKRALNYQAANIVASSIQPYHNLPVIKYIEEKVGSEAQLSWVQYHIGKGFAALEKLLKDNSRRYATGDEVYLADLFLAPQIHTAVTRFKVDMTQYPLLLRLHEEYIKLPAFQAAMPENQPDAPSSVTA